VSVRYPVLGVLWGGLGQGVLPSPFRFQPLLLTTLPAAALDSDPYLTPTLVPQHRVIRPLADWCCLDQVVSGSEVARRPRYSRVDEIHIGVVDEPVDGRGECGSEVAPRPHSTLKRQGKRT